MGKPKPGVSKALKGRVGNNKGKKLKQNQCPHCGIYATNGNLRRWHLDNCKLKGK